MTALARYLTSILSESLRTRSVVVWYDPGGTLSRCVETALPEGAQLHVHDGSYLALRVAFEEANPRLEQPAVVYVPRERQEPSWLDDLELAGCRLELGLKQLLTEAFQLELEPVLREALDGPAAAGLVAAWDELVPPADPTVRDVRRGLVGAVLGLTHRPSLEEIVLAYVGDHASEARLSRARVHDEFHSLLRTEAGWPVPAADSVTRQSVAAALLLCEAVTRGGMEPDGLGKVLPLTRHRSQWAAWADRWRRLAPQTFETLSDEVASVYRVQARLKPAAAAAVQSFRCVDEVVLTEIDVLIAQGQDGTALEMARLRAGSHWAEVARSRGVPQPWDAVVAAIEVRQGTNAAVDQLANRGEWPLGELLARYVHPEDGWWRIDDAFRRIDAHRNRLTPHLEKSLGAPAAHRYVEWVDALGLTTAACLRRGEWSADGWRTQGAITSEAVTRHGKTAVVLADALRFDLAMSLRRLLEERGLQVARHHALGVLPSVTQVGMAAILGWGDVEAEIRDGKLVPKLQDALLTGRKERLDAFKRRFPRSAAAPLSEVRQGHIPDRKADTLIVYTQDLDEQGDFLPQVGADHFDALVREMAEGIDALIRAGYRSVLVIPDHGFLKLPDDRPPRVLRVKAMADTARARRYLVGRPPEVEGTVRIGLDQIGWRSTQVAAFPVGAAVFGLPGEVPTFTHGGPTLQETALLALVAERAAAANPISVRLIEPKHIDTVLPRFVLEGDGGGVLLSEPRRVRVTVRSDGRVVGDSEPLTVAAGQRVEARVQLQEYGKIVEVSVEDYATREILESRTLIVALPEGYENLEL